MTTLYEHGIVVTLGAQNRVIWDGAVAVEGEHVSPAWERPASFAGRFPDAAVGRLHRASRSSRLHLHASPLLFHDGPGHGDPRRAGIQLCGDP